MYWFGIQTAFFPSSFSRTGRKTGLEKLIRMKNVYYLVPSFMAAVTVVRRRLATFV